MASKKAATGHWSLKLKLLSRFRSFKKKRDRPFIVPTAFGFIFGLVVLLLLMMALGSANNVLYIFVFFLASVSLSAMVVTNDNLERVSIGHVSATDCFADEDAVFKMLLVNKADRPSYMIIAKYLNALVQTDEINGLQEKTVSIHGAKFQRGYQKIPRLQITSTFPFGLLRSWKIYRRQDPFLVYPARKGSLPFPISSQNSQFLGESGLFRDLREYQSSDSPRRVDWRASLKHDKMLVKNFESMTEKAHAFEWEQTQAAGDFEARLSQLAFWIDQAEKSGIRYSLEIGALRSESNRGFDHWQFCLEHLALLQPNLEKTPKVANHES